MEKLLRVSEKTTVIIHAMSYMALKEQGEFSSVKEISDAISVARGYLAKILQPMVLKGLLLSIRGVGGGFYISARTRNMSLLELLVAIDGGFDTDTCIFSRPICSKPPCIISKLNEDIRLLVESRLSSISLTDFAEMTFLK